MPDPPEAKGRKAGQTSFCPKLTKLSRGIRFPRTLYGLEVFVKVRLMEILNVDAEEWQQYGRPASGLHVDFVLAVPQLSF
jgi:hypothetical protein